MIKLSPCWKKIKLGDQIEIYIINGCMSHMKISDTTAIVNVIGIDHSYQDILLVGSNDQQMTGFWKMNLDRLLMSYPAIELHHPTARQFEFGYWITPSAFLKVARIIKH